MPKAEPASLQSCLSVPLLMGESLVGVLSLYAPSANAFVDDCGRLIQMVAPHIAVGASHGISRVRRREERRGQGRAADCVSSTIAERRAV